MTRPIVPGDTVRHDDGTLGVVESVTLHAYLIRWQDDTRSLESGATIELVDEPDGDENSY